MAKMGRFRNPPGSPERNGQFGEMFIFVAQQMLSSFRGSIPDDHVLTKSEFTRSLEATHDPGILWLGHSAFVIRFGGKVILTDPFLGKRAGPAGMGPKRFAGLTISGADLPKADVLLVSHNHYDHLDALTIETYPFKQTTKVIVPLGLARFFVKRGYTKIVELDWWDNWQFDSLNITALPAIHNSGRGFGDKNKTLWASFGIYSNEGSIWFSGDTADGPVFDEVGRRAGPFDLALVAIGAYEPRSLMKSVHVNPEEAIDLARRLGAKKAIGMHWGTIALTPENPFSAPEKFRQAALAQGFGPENAITMKIGGALSFEMDK